MTTLIIIANTLLVLILIALIGSGQYNRFKHRSRFGRHLAHLESYLLSARLDANRDANWKG